jgi:uncharacterized cysteine cluster protein YcgN (CxxCxxCC family)
LHAWRGLGDGKVGDAGGGDAACDASPDETPGDADARPSIMTKRPTATPPTAFWRDTPLEAMSVEQWESLCDGCGRCCLVKLEDEESGRIHATDVGCRLFDAGTCRCRDYANRTTAVPDCVGLTPEVVRTLRWLPPTCGYRLVAEGQDLPWWHPLVSGTPDTVREAGISVAGKVHALEDDVALEDLVDRIRKWPLEWPRKARASKDRDGRA